MNLSKNNSDWLRSPLKIGGGTPESAQLLPLLVWVVWGGVCVRIVAPMVSVGWIPLISMGEEAEISRGAGVSGRANIMCLASWYWESVSDQWPSPNSFWLSIWSDLRIIQSAEFSMGW